MSIAKHTTKIEDCVLYKKKRKIIGTDAKILYGITNIKAVLEMDDDMSKEEICEKVRSICKEENVEFLFITEGKSCWSFSKNEHIRKVAHFHKENEKNVQQTEEKLKEMESD